VPRESDASSSSAGMPSGVDEGSADVTEDTVWDVTVN
jgi:hypothetical protein